MDRSHCARVLSARLEMALFLAGGHVFLLFPPTVCIQIAQSLDESQRFDPPQNLSVVTLSLSAAESRILRDHAAFSGLKPRIEKREDLFARRTSQAELLLRVCAPAENGSLDNVKPGPLASVVVVTLTQAVSGVRAFLSAVRDTETRAIVVVASLAEARAAIEMVNAGEAHAILIRTESDFHAQLNATVDRLDRSYRQGLSACSTSLLANGFTGFLADPVITELIEDAAANYHAEEVYIGLDPPGILMRKTGASPEFLLICDEDYYAGLQEIGNGEAENSARDQSPYGTPGLAEDGGIDILSELLATGQKLGRNKKWRVKQLSSIGSSSPVLDRLLGKA